MSGGREVLDINSKILRKEDARGSLEPFCRPIDKQLVWNTLNNLTIKYLIMNAKREIKNHKNESP